jgi:hypothetical protein
MTHDFSPSRPQYSLSTKAIAFAALCWAVGLALGLLIFRH